MECCSEYRDKMLCSSARSHLGSKLSLSSIHVIHAPRLLVTQPSRLSERDWEIERVGRGRDITWSKCDTFSLNSVLLLIFEKKVRDFL